MIAISTSIDGYFGRLIEEGVRDFALSNANARWREMVLIPLMGLTPERLAYYRLDGLIMMVQSPALLQQILAMDIPAVDVASWLRPTLLPTIMIDDIAVGRAAGRYFMEKGYRHFGYLPGHFQVPPVVDRGTGYASVIAAAGHTVSWHGDFPKRLPKGAIRATGPVIDWVRSLPKPVAIFAWHDGEANPLYAIVQAARFTIPDEVAILGVDNEPLAHFGTLGVSSMELPVKQVGYRAAALLDRMLDGQRLTEAERIVSLLPGEIFTRTSSDTRAINDKDITDALQFIREHACEGIRLDDVVRAVPMSRRSLQRRFVSAVGTTITRQIASVRVANAQKLLLATSMSIKEITKACGFGDRNQFLVAFHAATGQSPRQFRNKNG